MFTQSFVVTGGGPVHSTYVYVMYLYEAASFAGIDRGLLISSDGDNETRIRQHKAAVEAAKRANVGFIAYTSIGRSDDSTIFLAEVHRATEAAIRDSAIPYSFLRNNWYTENEIGTVQAVLGGAPWLTSAGSGRVGWAARRDYAHAAAALLAGSGHENTVCSAARPSRWAACFAVWRASFSPGNN